MSPSPRTEPRRSCSSAASAWICCCSISISRSSTDTIFSEQYAAIVIDSDMPRHSGFGVITYLREEVGEQLDNVIVLTSSDEDTLRKKLSQEQLKVVNRDKAVDALSTMLTSE